MPPAKPATSEQLRTFAETIVQIRRLLDFAARLTKQLGRDECWTWDQDLLAMQCDAAALADSLTVQCLARWNSTKASQQEVDRDRVRKRETA